MVDVSAAILKGKWEATRLHQEFGMSKRIAAKGGRIDVFGTIVKSGVPLLFRPLEGLLGVFIKEPILGVMVTTKRSLNIQRFTGAHELGHCTLGHSPSLDDSQSILPPMTYSAVPDDKQQEIEANAFATEFMLPPWLFAAHFKRQNWTSANMTDPMTVYQLSLRVGASYEATGWSLMRPGVSVIEQGVLDNLRRVQPKQIKQELLKDYEPLNWQRDVWLLTEKDEGAVIEGSSSDLFVLKLKEHSGSGYVWTFDELNEAGFAIVRDEREGPASDAVGGHTIRSITTYLEGAQEEGRMELAEKRPWVTDGVPLCKFSVHYNLNGPEVKGLPQKERRLLLEASA